MGGGWGRDTCRLRGKDHRMNVSKNIPVLFLVKPAFCGNSFKNLVVLRVEFNKKFLQSINLLISFTKLFGGKFYFRFYHFTFWAWITGGS